MSKRKLRALPDEELVRIAVQQADTAPGRDAASELLGRHRDRVYAWCYRHVREHERALDLAQEVLVGAYRALATFQGNSRFTSWLFAITRNRCLSALRSPSLLLDDDEDALWQIADPATRVDVRLEEEQQQRLVLELIQRELDPIEQDALWMRCHERMPVDEITRVLRITQSSGARGVLQSARRKLRAALERRAAERGTGQ